MSTNLHIYSLQKNKKILVTTTKLTYNLRAKITYFFINKLYVYFIYFGIYEFSMFIVLKLLALCKM